MAESASARSRAAGSGRAPQVDGDVAFLVAVAPVLVAGPRDVLQAAGLVALGLEDRMQEQAHGEAAGLQLAQDRIDEERHVVVDDLDDRALGAALLGAGAMRRTRILCRPFGLSAMNSQRLAGIAGEPGRRPARRSRQALRP